MARPIRGREPAPEPVAEEEGEDESEEEEEEPLPDCEITRRFDSSKNDLVLDLKTLSEIPFDPDGSGIKTFRAFVFEKGKAVHNPHEAGQYIVSGEWYEQWNLGLVFFKDSTKRKPEFLLNFVDYGMLSDTISGISVETLALPLKIRKNVYNDCPRLTVIEDIAGFAAIDPGSTPWSVNLAPCLKKLPQFVLHDIMAPRHLLEWVKKKTLRQQFTKLEVATRKAITTEVEAMRQQDASQAEKIAQIYLARLKKTMALLDALPPEAYEVERRIIALAPDDTSNDITFESPLRKKVLQGSCDALVRTQLVARAQLPIAPTPAPAQALSPVPEAIGEEVHGSDDEEGEAEGEVQATEVMLLEPRQRVPTSRFEPDRRDISKPPAAGAKKQKVTKRAEVAAGDDAGRWGINERTGEPYRRAPYKKLDPSLRLLARAAKSAKGGSSNVGPVPEAPPKPAPVPGADPKQLQALKEKVAALTQQVTELKGELALAQADIKAAQATARSEGIESVRAELAAALMEAKNEYKAGLQDGARLATGKKFALNRSCASSSAASSKSKRRTERAEESSESD